MTKDQALVLKFIKKFWIDEGYSPSLNEIAQHMKWKAASQAHYTVQSLKERGKVKTIPGKTRSVEPLV